MKAKTKIQKGKNFENFICQMIEDAGLGKSIRTPGSGSGKLKGDIFSPLEFMIEAKNQKTLHIQKWIRQAKDQARIGNANPDKWCLVFKEPDSPDTNPEALVVIDFNQFLSLLQKNQEPKIKEPDKEMKWELEKLKSSMNRIIKKL